MSLKSYLDPLEAFEKWLKANPEGGNFSYMGKTYLVTPRKNLKNT